jgi:hypothetical protein
VSSPAESGETLLLRYIDERFAAVHGRIDGVEYEVRQGNRGLHHRLDEMQEQNSDEHRQVVEALRFFGVQQGEQDSRIDSLEQERDHRAGAWSIVTRAAGAAGVVAGLVIAAIALFL